MDTNFYTQRIFQAEYLMQEIRELQLHIQDLRDEHELLLHDNHDIKQTTNVQKLILTRDYFKVEDRGDNSDFLKAACDDALRKL